MVKYDVIFVDFPHRQHDGTSSKHPAIVLEGNRLARLAAQVTSNLDSIRDTDYELQDWESAGLDKPCKVCLNQQEAFTEDAVIKQFGHLTRKDINEIEKILRKNESLNESNNSYSYGNYSIINFGNCWVAKDSNNRIVCKRETSDEVENWIDEQSNFDEALTLETDDDIDLITGQWYDNIYVPEYDEHGRPYLPKEFWEDWDYCENENLSFKCPHCGNNELRCIEHGVNIPADVDFHEIFICDECGSEYLSEPQYDGKIKFKIYYESDL